MSPTPGPAAGPASGLNPPPPDQINIIPSTPTRKGSIKDTLSNSFGRERRPSHGNPDRRSGDRGSSDQRSNDHRNSDHRNGEGDGEDIVNMAENPDFIPQAVSPRRGLSPVDDRSPRGLSPVGSGPLSPARSLSPGRCHSQGQSLSPQGLTPQPFLSLNHSNTSNNSNNSSTSTAQEEAIDSGDSSRNNSVTSTDFPIGQTIPLLNLSTSSLNQPHTRTTSVGSLLFDSGRRLSSTNRTNIIDFIDNGDLGSDFKANTNWSHFRNPRIKRERREREGREHKEERPTEVTESRTEVTESRTEVTESRTEVPQSQQTEVPQSQPIDSRNDTNGSRDHSGSNRSSSSYEIETLEQIQSKNNSVPFKPNFVVE